MKVDCGKLVKVSKPLECHENITKLIKIDILHATDCQQLFSAIHRTPLKSFVQITISYHSQSLDMAFRKIKIIF